MDRESDTVHTAKRPTLRRLIIIDRELRNCTYPTADRLAELTEVDTKTIRRDLDLLRDDYRAPIEFNRARKGWEYTCKTYRLPAMVTTEGELLAMFLASQTLGHATGTPYEEDLRRAVQKLADLLPDEISFRWQTVTQAHSFRQTVTTQHDLEVFRQLADAVLHRRQLQLRYYTASRNVETSRTLDPWHLSCIDGDWFLIAWCHERKSLRTFSPARIRELSLTGQTFDVQEFNVDDFFAGTFKVIRDDRAAMQVVKLRFAPSAAKYICEKTWHTSQKLQPEPDGSLLVEMMLGSLIEVRRWILSWGCECEVLEPAALRADILREATAMLANSDPDHPRVSNTLPRTAISHQLQTESGALTTAARRRRPLEPAPESPTAARQNRSGQRRQ